MIRDSKKTFTDYFRKPVDPKELVRKWQADIRAEQRQIEKQIREIQREEQKAVRQVKEAAKRGDTTSAKILAREIVHTRKTISQLYMNKAHMISMNAQLSEQLGVAKVAGTLSKSTQVMKMMTDLLKVPQLNATMAEMSREMMKAGMIDEIMDDAMEGITDTEDLEEETEAELDKILTEVAGESLSQMMAAPRSRIAQPQRQQTPEAEPADTEQDELAARLQAIRS